MKTPMLAAVGLALMAAACVDTVESTPDIYYTPVPASWEPSAPVVDMLTTDQPLTISGRLDGTLRGIALASDTTDNFGSYTTFDTGPDYLNASIATLGDGGAGMLIISLSAPSLREKLLDGHWSSVSQSTTSFETAANVSSCAGPVIGEWPYEIGSTEYEMDATEDPARPGTVVLAVSARFPRTEADSSSTTELAGTLRFPMPPASD
jgi:hypothetical protein